MAAVCAISTEVIPLIFVFSFLKDVIDHSTHLFIEDYMFSKMLYNTIKLLWDRLEQELVNYLEV